MTFLRAQLLACNIDIAMSANIQNPASFFMYLRGRALFVRGWCIHTYSGPVEAGRGAYVAASAGWLFWDLRV
jgi:hypothetical protein